MAMTMTADAERDILFFGLSKEDGGCWEYRIDESNQMSGINDQSIETALQRIAVMEVRGRNKDGTAGWGAWKRPERGAAPKRKPKPKPKTLSGPESRVRQLLICTYVSLTRVSGCIANDIDALGHAKAVLDLTVMDRFQIQRSGRSWLRMVLSCPCV
jgi:hypothetical protein